MNNAADNRWTGTVRWTLRWLVAHGLARTPRRGAAARFHAAVVKVDQLGDGALALGAVRVLVEHYGEANCLLVVSPHAEPLFAAEFPQATRLIVPAALVHRQLLTIGRAQRERFRDLASDAVICLRHQRGDWDELLLRWLDGSRTYVLDSAAIGRPSAQHRTFVHTPAQRVRLGATAGGPLDFCRELERHRLLVSACLGRSITMEEVLPRFTHLGKNGGSGAVVVTPFGTNKIRDFPPSLLMAAFRAIRRYSAAPICLYGSPTQQQALHRIAGLAAAAGLSGVTCVPSGNTLSYIEAIAAAEAVVTVETATAHIATGFDRPTLVLIGGGHLDEFGPWRRSDRQVWLTETVECAGCNWDCRHPEPFCLTRIPESTVTLAISKIYALACVPPSS